VYVLGNATIREIIKTMAGHNIHRVYVCNSHKQKEPIGIVNITGQQHEQSDEAEGEAQREERSQMTHSLSISVCAAVCLCRSDVLLEILSN
jgi:hypothetical protein